MAFGRSSRSTTISICEASPLNTHPMASTVVGCSGESIFGEGVVTSKPLWIYRLF